jgi:hypothetical protein
MSSADNGVSPIKPRIRRPVYDSEPVGLYRQPDGSPWSRTHHERERKKRERLAQLEKKARSNVPEALRLFFEIEADAAGLSLDQMLATIRPGPVSERERPAYERLARLVYELRTPVELSRERRAVANALRLKQPDERLTPPTLAAIGTALGGLTRAQVQRLEDRGRAACARGCSRHGRFRHGCPKCIELLP